jgi:hypothetical protein
MLRSLAGDEPRIFTANYDAIKPVGDPRQIIRCMLNVRQANYAPHLNNSNSAPMLIRPTLHKHE